MKRLTALVLVCLLVTAPAFAQGPTPAQKAEADQLRSEAREWTWAGYGTMIGGFVYEILGQTALASENTFCASAFNLAACTTTKDPNMGAVYGGAIMVGIGGIMTIVGAQKSKRARRLAPELLFTPHGYTIQKRLTF